jgi:hypothetical protein
MRSSQAGDRKQSAVFHGQGGQRDKEKDELEQYCRLVDAALQPLLNGQRLPMFLVGAEPLTPIYRQANRYPHLSEQRVKGNADRVTATALHGQVWPLVEASLARVHESAAEQYQRQRNSDRTSTDLAKIVAAAYQGKIDTLFLVKGAQQWGTFDAVTHTTAVHTSEEPGDEDLVDLAAVQTLVNRGSVYTLAPPQAPDDAPVSALFRF